MNDVNPTPAPKQLLVSEQDLREMISWLDQSSDTFNQLSVLFSTIQKELDKYSDAAALVKVGKALAADWSNMIECERETYEHKCLPPLKKENAA